VKHAVGKCFSVFGVAHVVKNTCRINPQIHACSAFQPINMPVKNDEKYFAAIKNRLNLFYSSNLKNAL